MAISTGHQDHAILQKMVENYIKRIYACNSLREGHLSDNIRKKNVTFVLFTLTFETTKWITRFNKKNFTLYGKIVCKRFVYCFKVDYTFGKYVPLNANTHTNTHTHTQIHIYPKLFKNNICRRE